jgi:cob(I)alamin adenosyltransferase
MSKLSRGYVHVYTGNGKGKTTAALGLALRASGAGLKVYVQQFLKNGNYSEIKALGKIANIKVSQCGSGHFVIGKPDMSNIECAKKGFEAARKNIASGEYDLVILDEINVAVRLGLIDVGEMEELMRRRPRSVELVLTGRGCPSAIKKRADIVTDMRETRHSYHQGAIARRGIEC